jgi:hypothetical protein
MESQVSGVLAVMHLIALAGWGGVVATEAVIEIAPFRLPELHPAAIRFHYWIDLLVELPLVLLVVATGVALALLTPALTVLHAVKIAFGAAAVTVNVFCILVVVRRGRRLQRGGGDQALWRASRVVLACFASGLLAAAVAAALGLRFALLRLG